MIVFDVEVHASASNSKQATANTDERAKGGERERKIEKKKMIIFIGVAGSQLSVDLPVPYQIPCAHTGHMLITNIGQTTIS